MNPTPDLHTEEQALLQGFVDDHRLFLGPDPAIIRDHKMSPRSAAEEEILSGTADAHRYGHIRGRILASLDECHTLVSQMGVAPGAKWGDFTTAIYTASGDASMIAQRGVLVFAGLLHYPIKFILKYWQNDPTVGIRDGDAFIHNDARYGGVHNTDQSMIMPVFWRDELICWLASTVHEGENGACEPGGMPGAAENKYDDGLMMSPLRLVENFAIRRDLITFLQNSVRDPKLQLEDTKVKLHSVMRLRKRVLAILEEHGREALIGALRKNMEDVEVEVRRRISELPDGTTRGTCFMDSTLRENALMKICCAITVKGDRMTFDFRGSSPQFANRSINGSVPTLKANVASVLLTYIWPDLPQTTAVLTPIEVLTDANSMFDAHNETSQAMGITPLFKTLSVPIAPLMKLGFSLPNRYTAVVSTHYDQPACFIYGGMTQHGEVVGNFCADINGAGQGARSHRDGESAIFPVFGCMVDTGEHELSEEEVPMIRLGAQVLARDRVGCGKYRGGLGYEQIVTFKNSPNWGFMLGCTGSKFSGISGLFGGYGSPAYVLCKIKGVNIFEIMKAPDFDATFDIVHLMNDQPIPGAVYSTHDMGMAYELAQEGEIYMICQGGGGGYGDVLERDPQAVMRDLSEDLVSHATAEDIFRVVYDHDRLLVDEPATEAARDAARRSRIARGKPFDEFLQDWVSAEPPTDLPYYGSWDDPTTIWAGAGPSRVRMDGNALQGVILPDPKDVRIGALEAELSLLTDRLRAAAEGA